MKRKLICAILAVVVLSGIDAIAEDNTAVKTNLLYDALLNVNIGVERSVAPRWSIDVSGNYNGWRLSRGRQWKHWLIQPELRYWLQGENLNGHFFAGHLFGGQFNTTLNHYRRQGWAAGIGVGYGYMRRFGGNWGVEAEIALGYARYSYDKFPCSECGRKKASRHKNYLGPTKAAVSLVYYFGDSRKKEPATVIPDEPVMEPAIEPVEIAVTDTLPDFNFPLVDVPHSKILTANLAGVARVQFKVNGTEIDAEFGNNMTELDAITCRLDSISKNLGMDIRRIELIGYASPEGAYRDNERLASARTEALKSFIKSERQIPDSVIVVSHVAEDWDGLKNAINASTHRDKETLLEIIDSDRSLDGKEKALRRHEISWEWINKEIFPGLRRTEYRIEYQHQYEELELQTLEEVNRCITNGNIDEAARLLVDVPSSPEADYARGVVAAKQHRYSEAKAWLLRAGSRGIKQSAKALQELKAKIKK